MKISKTIFWDWNGTMLDDIHICIEAMNLMLRERELQLLDEEVYRNVFTFPVRDYYSKIGFDFDIEPFEKPALEFIENYDDMVKEASIFSDTIMALDAFRSRG